MKRYFICLASAGLALVFGLVAAGFPSSGYAQGGGQPIFLPLIVKSGAAPATRPWPETSSQIRVFNDQIATGLSAAQIQFAASHYAGSQKQSRSFARQLRAYNPNYLVLHYRLGQALGHSVPASGCAPSSDYIAIIDGDHWVREWPGDGVVQDNWFFHWNGSRVFHCQWGHYLMDLDDPGWRAWWSAQVIQQLQDNEDDGVFADSYSVPNYLGGYAPALPTVDATFESQWAAEEHAFTDYIKAQFAGRWKWIPNIGAYITTRDPSDYSNLDGAMLEGFAEWGSGGYFAVDDWILQMNRVLALAAADKIIIGQTYPDETDVQERLFVLGSYLLIKGRYTYINLETSMYPEWFPEYGVDLGQATGPLPADISAFYKAGWGVYARQYANGLVVVNPGETARAFSLGGSYRRLLPSGGGEVPADGTAPGSLATTPVSSLNLPAHSAAILLKP